jgi:hypothetical protein
MSTIHPTYDHLMGQYNNNAESNISSIFFQYHIHFTSFKAFLPYIYSLKTHLCNENAIFSKEL